MPGSTPVTSEVLDVAGARALLGGISEPVLREAMRHQGLPYRRVGGTLLRFSRSAIVAWLGSGSAADDVRALA